MKEKSKSLDNLTTLMNKGGEGKNLIWEEDHLRSIIAHNVGKQMSNQIPDLLELLIKIKNILENLHKFNVF